MSEGRSPERLRGAAACGRDLMAKPGLLAERSVPWGVKLDGALTDARGPNRLTRRVAGVAACLALLLAGVGCELPGPPDAEHSGCHASLIPSSTSVRPAGKVRVAGKVCSGNPIRIQQRQHGSWRRIGTARADQAGEFAACVRLRRAAGPEVEMRAVAGSGAAARATVRISARGASGCRLHLLRQDLATDPDPTHLWGGILAVSPTRHQWFASGGPDGGPFRQMTVVDGDLFHGDSERAELGNSDYIRDSRGRLQTFFLYRAGTRRVTSFWMRLPPNFPIDTDDWQVVMQMKETDPATNTGGTPVIALQATQGQWQLKQSLSPGPSHDTRVLWRTPAKVGIWTHIVVDATYASDPSKGLFQITIGGARSPTLHTYTLKHEISPPGPGLHSGEPIPSHLRLGIYHDPALPGTSVDIARVQVFG